MSQKEKTDLTDPFQNYILGIYSILEMHFAGDKEKHSNAIDDFLVVREIFIKALLAVLAGKIKPTNIEAFREVLQVVNKTEILQMSSLEQNKDAVKVFLNKYSHNHFANISTVI